MLSQQETRRPKPYISTHIEYLIITYHWFAKFYEYDFSEFKSWHGFGKLGVEIKIGIIERIITQPKSSTLKFKFMSTNSPTPISSSEKQIKNSGIKNIIIGSLSVLLIGLGGYMIYQKSDNSRVMQQQDTKIATITNEKSEVQSSFDASLARLDSMATVTTGLQNQLSEKNTEIASAKEQIRKILNNKNATASELAHAKKLISGLNDKISGMETEIARLTQENQTLNVEKTALTADKEKLTTDLVTTTTQNKELEKKVDIASTLNASNIVITPVNIKNNGREKVSTKAKKVDKLVVSFDVANRIIQDGQTDVYVVVVGPDGQPVTTNNTSGLFTTREDGDKTYTAKVPVDLETSKTKNVNFTFAPSTSFQTGAYKIMIYQNGFLIGQGSKELRKGGLFS